MLWSFLDLPLLPLVLTGLAFQSRFILCYYLRMIIDRLKSYIQQKAHAHPRYSWSTNTLPLSRVNYYGALQNGRNANLLVSGASWIARHYTEPEIRIWERKTDGTIAPYAGTGSQEFYDILETPNPFFTDVELEMASVIDLIFDGNAYLRKIRDEDTNKPIMLFWMPSWTCEPKWDNDRPNIFITHYEYKPDPMLKGEEIPPEDVIHISWFRDPMNPRKGISPIKSLLREVYADEKAANFVSALLRNMGLPGIVLSPADNETTEPLTDDDVRATKQQFMNIAGGDNIGAVVVMDAEMKIDKITFSPEELDLAAIRHVSEERVASVLGLYPEILGLGSGNDTSDFTEMLETSYQSTVMFIQRLFQTKLKKDLLSEFVSRFTLRRLSVVYDNTNVAILSRLMNEKAKRFGLGVLYGWTEVAEARFEFGMPIREEDRIYLRRKGTYAVRENDVLEESIPSGDPTSGEGDGTSDGPGGEVPEADMDMASLLPIVIDTPEDLEQIISNGLVKRNGSYV